MRAVTIKTTFQDVLDTVFDYAVEQGVMNQAFADILKAKDTSEQAIADKNKDLTSFGQDLFDNIGVTYQHRIACDLNDDYEDDYYDLYTLTFKN